MQKTKSLAVALGFSLGLCAPLWFGGMTAQAADLGGDCCADLEERVVELEATTVRKGNRKVSVRISGWVNNALLFWDDGEESNAYVTTNGNASTRFWFDGKAKISSDLSAGYYIEVESRSPALSFFVDQNNDNRNQAGLVVRQSNLYVKSNRLGSIRLGLASVATDDINWRPTVGGFVFYEQGSFHYESGFLLRRTDTGALANLRIGDFCGNLQLRNVSCFDSNNRQNVVRYDSPTFAGFSVAATWGEDDFWDVHLKYKGKAGDFKLAGAVAYAEDVDSTNTTGGPESKQFYLTGGIMHVPTGLFVNANYWTEEIDNTGLSLPDSHTWYVQAGIVRKWTSKGDTKIWGSYTESEDAFIAGAAIDGGLLLDGELVSSSKLSRWNVGIAQNIDAAALQLYLVYRHTEIDVSTEESGALGFEDFDVVVVGGVIRF